MNNNRNFRYQHSNRLKEIESHLEREIGQILSKKRFSPEYHRYKSAIDHQDINTRLKEFLDRGSDYQEVDDDYDDNYEDDYYEEDEDYSEEDEDYPDYDDNYLPFEEGELEQRSSRRREQYPDDFIEDLLLDALMPIVAQWLDINIDRIVENVVKKSIRKPLRETREAVYKKRTLEEAPKKRLSFRKQEELKLEQANKRIRVRKEEPQPKRVAQRRQEQKGRQLETTSRTSRDTTKRPSRTKDKR